MIYEFSENFDLDNKIENNPEILEKYLKKIEYHSNINIIKKFDCNLFYNISNFIARYEVDINTIYRKFRNYIKRNRNVLCEENNIIKKEIKDCYFRIIKKDRQEEGKEIFCNELILLKSSLENFDISPIESNITGLYKNIIDENDYNEIDDLKEEVESKIKKQYDDIKCFIQKNKPYILFVYEDAEKGH